MDSIDFFSTAKTNKMLYGHFISLMYCMDNCYIHA